jgi:predicted small lipoprotein YifL
MHDRRPGRSVALSIVATLAIILAGCGNRGNPSVPPAPASAEPQASPTAQQSEGSPAAASVQPSAVVASENPAKVVQGQAYRPTIVPAEFTTEITNPFMPLVPGTALTYKGGSEKNVFNVTDRTREVMGVTTIVVRDKAYQGSELVEDTEDWFAQDAAGNVWYFGEATAECQGNRIVSHHGAWEAGVDGAQPGIVMLANPQLGDYYRQEYLKGEAEDVAKVVRLNETISHTLGTYPDVLITEDFTRLEPQVVEHKKYAPGVGLVEEQIVKGGSEIVELVKIDPSSGSGPSTAGDLCQG